MVKFMNNVIYLLNQLEPVDLIFHLAADPDVRNSVPKPLNSYDHNMNGTMNILEYISAHLRRPIRAALFVLAPAQILCGFNPISAINISSQTEERDFAGFLH